MCLKKTEIDSMPICCPQCGIRMFESEKSEDADARRTVRNMETSTGDGGWIATGPFQLWNDLATYFH